MSSRKLFDRNQFFYVVLLALIFSGLLRIGLEFRDRDGCHGRDQGLHRLPVNSTLEGDRGEEGERGEGEGDIPNGVLRSLHGLPSWELPERLAPGFADHTVDPAKFQLHIKLLTYDRADSVERCLKSLEAAAYDGDTVHLDIFVDHPFDELRSKWSPSYVNKVKTAHEVLRKVESLPWTHGQKKIYYRTHNGGIQSQWLEAWWPSSVNEFAFIVEDDMELSPAYYKYFKHLVALYYYDRLNYDPEIYGLSFQRQYFVPGVGGRQVGTRRQPFLYQLVGTWGQFLFPVPWKQFRVWYDTRRHNESREPILEGLKTTQWWYNKGNKLWTPWIIKWAHAEQMYNIYTFFPRNLSLSISHREVGSNFRIHRKADGQLLTLEDFKNPSSEWVDLPPAFNLQRFDFCYHEVKRLEAARTTEELQTLVEGIHRAKAVALIMVPVGGYDLARNWLCHIEGLDLQNYLLVVPEEEIAEDLAKRGHPVYFLRLSKEQSRASVSQRGRALLSLEGEWTQEHLRVALLVLAMGYNVLVCSPDTVWHGNPFRQLKDSQFDVQGVLDTESLSHSFLFVRSSEKTIAAWGALLQNERQERKVLQSVGSQVLSKATSFQRLYMAPFSTLEDANLTSGSVPVVLGVKALTKEEKIRRMAHAGLWVIDDYDHACKAVTCRKKGVAV